MLQRNTEKEMQPWTLAKGDVLARILFRRRERFKNRNLIVIYFEGVLGDITTKSGTVHQFRVRQGALSCLRKLSLKS